MNPFRWAGLAVLFLGCAALCAQEQPFSGNLGIDERSLLGEPSGRPLEGQELDEATIALASKLRCPICQGLSVADSPTASALAMLSQVRDLFAAGYTRDQILAYFESTYGEFIRLEPRAEGFNLIVWLGPIAALATGVSILGLRRRSTNRSASSADHDELEPYLDRVRAEVDPTDAD